MIDILQECDKILGSESKRRAYTKELRKIMKAREKRETVKRLTMQNNFKKKTPALRIPSPPASQDEIIDNE